MALPPLYKYLDVTGAKLTLGNRTFKHSKPSDFNDSEDLTAQSLFPEDVETALAKMVASSTDLIIKNVNTPPTCALELREKITVLQEVYRQNPQAANLVREEFNKNDAMRKMYDIDHMRQRSQAFIAEINAHMQRYRVLCVSTLKDSEYMWREYAENHKGIVLRIQPSLEKDSKFQLFRAVEYRRSRPSLYDDALEFLEGSLFGDQEDRTKAAVEKIVYTKTLKWKHEGEYRLAIPLLQGEKPWNLLSFHPEEITELYLGLVMGKADRHDIVKKALVINPEIAIYQAHRSADERLAFRRVRFDLA